MLWLQIPKKKIFGESNSQKEIYKIRNKNEENFHNL